MRFHFASELTKNVRLSSSEVTVTCTEPNLTALNIPKAAGRKLRNEDTTQDLESLQVGDSIFLTEKFRTICPVDLFLPVLSQVAVTSASVSLSSPKKLLKSRGSTSNGSFGSQVIFGCALSKPINIEEFITATKYG